MDLHLKDRVVVITGGTAGIGKAAAFSFAREGAKVAVVARNPERLEQLRKEAHQAGYTFYCEQNDVTDPGQMAEFARRVWEMFGRIDIWVNNAGLAKNKDCTEFTLDDWNQIMDVNLKAVFFCSQIAAQYMKKQGFGVIINASSYASKIPHAEGSIYAASKAGVSSLTRTFAACLAPFGIRVVGYIPGMIQTEMSAGSISEHKDKYIKDISMHRLGTTEDMADPIVFLASDSAGYITGVDVEITGGKYAVQNCDYNWRQTK